MIKKVLGIATTLSIFICSDGQAAPFTRNGPFLLQSSTGTTKCLTVAGTGLTQATCNPQDPNQVWRSIQPSRSSSSSSGSSSTQRYYLFSPQNRLCVDAASNPLVLASCTPNATTQQWVSRSMGGTATATISAKVLIVSQKGCLTIPRAGIVDTQHPITAEACGIGLNQQFAQQYLASTNPQVTSKTKFKAISSKSKLATASSSSGSTNDPSALPPGFSGTFKHPGLLMNQEQLDLIKTRVAGNSDPQLKAYNALKASDLSSSSYEPHVYDQVSCDSASSNDHGCKDEMHDSTVAYTNALAWIVTGNAANAAESIKILNSWSSHLKSQHGGSNARLQAGWASSVWAEAAEIIRYGNGGTAGWSATDAAAFAKMLRDLYVPVVSQESYKNNWLYVQAQGLISMGVFLDDPELFNKGIEQSRQNLSGYINSDGTGQETCRDSRFWHQIMGMNAAVDIAEIAFQQGVDLYTEQADLLTKGFEFHANLLVSGQKANCSSAGGFSGGDNPNEYPGGWEVVYNQFVTRRGGTMSMTKNYLDKIRPTGFDHITAWETLTHGEIGGAGGLSTTQQ